MKVDLLAMETFICTVLGCILLNGKPLFNYSPHIYATMADGFQHGVVCERFTGPKMVSSLSTEQMCLETWESETRRNLVGIT